MKHQIKHQMMRASGSMLRQRLCRWQAAGVLIYNLRAYAAFPLVRIAYVSAFKKAMEERKL